MLRSPILKGGTMEATKDAFTVHDTTNDTTKYGKYLVPKSCGCGDKTVFLCYPEDGCCVCGVHKHHVHCRECGGISQTG